jgi:hypothetical protein
MITEIRTAGYNHKAAQLTYIMIVLAISSKGCSDIVLSLNSYMLLIRATLLME